MIYNDVIKVVVRVPKIGSNAVIVLAGLFPILIKCLEHLIILDFLSLLCSLCGLSVII